MKRLCILISMFSGIYGINYSLSDWKAYASRYEEMPESDNHDWDDPDYSSYHKMISPHFVTHFLRKIFFFHEKNHIDTFFNDYTERLHAATRSACQEPVCAKTVALAPDSRVYVWGDLYGSLHALVRALDFLQQEGVIDEQLRIVKEQCYFVFLGNVISRSPYILETLSLVAQLCLQNPNNVFYLRGKQEQSSYWKSFGTFRALEYRVSIILSERKSIENRLDEIFDKLPQVIFFEAPCGKTFECVYDPTSYFIAGYADLNKGKPASARLIGQGDRPIAMGQKGLVFAGMQDTCLVWKVFSAYNDVYKRFAGRLGGSFVAISCGKSEQDTTIRLYDENTGSYKKTAEYELLSGEPVALARKIEGMHLQSIDIGSTMDLKKQLSSLGKQIQTGLVGTAFAFNNTNASLPYFIRYMILNDSYIPYRAYDNSVELIKKGYAQTLLLPLGSITLATYYKHYQEMGIPILFPVTGSSLFRDTNLINMVHLRPSYDDELAALIPYMITNYRMRRFAFFYQDDEHGRGPVEAAHRILKSYGITEWLDVPYMRNAFDFKKQVEAIEAYRPDVIGLLSVPAETKAFLRQLGAPHLYNKKCFGISLIADEDMRSFFNYLGVSCVLAHPVPHPVHNKMALAQEYRDLMKSQDTAPTVYAFEAYVGTSLLLDALAHISTPGGGDLGKALIKHFESYKNYVYKGLQLTFDPATRSLSQPVWIDPGYDADWIPVFPEKSQRPKNIQPSEQKKIGESGSPKTTGP